MTEKMKATLEHADDAMTLFFTVVGMMVAQVVFGTGEVAAKTMFYVKDN